MQCKQMVKGVQCPNEATMEVFWPGQTSQQCQEHTEKLHGLAAFMGFRLDSRPLQSVNSESSDSSKGAK